MAESRQLVFTFIVHETHAEQVLCLALLYIFDLPLGSTSAVEEACHWTHSRSIRIDRHVAALSIQDRIHFLGIVACNIV